MANNSIPCFTLISTKDFKSSKGKFRVVSVGVIESKLYQINEDVLTLDEAIDICQNTKKCYPEMIFQIFNDQGKPLLIKTV